MSIPVVNDAIAGRSARSYTREGRFDAIAAVVQSGDWVIIEFGFNDGGNISAADKGRPDCPGEGNQTCQGIYNGTLETVHTFNVSQILLDMKRLMLSFRQYYLETAGRKFQSLGANVLISGQTTVDPYVNRTFNYSPTQFVQYANDTAVALGADFVAHGAYVAEFYKMLGADVVDSFYPLDNTHTSPIGATVVAAAFVKGVLCGDSSLKDYIVNSTRSVYGHCLR